MSDDVTVIIGSGIVGTAIAYTLASKGHKVVVLEKGPEYPYPHRQQFVNEIQHVWRDWRLNATHDLRKITSSGDYKHNLDDERIMRVGGMASEWYAVTPRAVPNDFRTKTAYGYGEDWPITYDDLEKYYGRAEVLLGVAGTDADNPFAPPRSSPYPLPPFELAYDDLLLKDRLEKNGIHLHTTPQARAREAYDSRPACMAFTACQFCPTGARYSPAHHLAKAQATGNCEVYANASVRAIVMDPAGAARAVMYRVNGESTDKELPAKAVVIAAGTLDAARLLLLTPSKGGRKLGDQAGHVGRHFMMHLVKHGHLDFKEALYPLRFGGATGQLMQWIDGPDRGKAGRGFRVHFSSAPHFTPHVSALDIIPKWRGGAALVEGMRPVVHCRGMSFYCESTPDGVSHVRLSDKKDRFGDPVAHLHFKVSDFDRGSFKRMAEVHEQLRVATGAVGAKLDEDYSPSLHYFGTCRMGKTEREGVVDGFGRIHGAPNVFIAGGATFPTASGVNPTLTFVAQGLRAADYMLDQVLL